MNWPRVIAVVLIAGIAYHCAHLIAHGGQIN